MSANLYQIEDLKKKTLTLHDFSKITQLQQAVTTQL